jgi:hypothetical protein
MDKFASALTQLPFSHRMIEVGDLGQWRAGKVVDKQMESII